MTEKHCTNVGTDYAETDQFICSNCEIHLEDWTEVDEGGNAHEYVFRFCPNCGAMVVKE